MNAPIFFAAVAGRSSKPELLYIWEQATPEGKAIIVCLGLFSILAWSVMISKALQMRRARRLNQFFTTEFGTQQKVLDMFDRRIQAEGCPFFAVYQAGSVELDSRLKLESGEGRKRHMSLKAMEHVKRTLENAVARFTLKGIPPMPAPGPSFSLGRSETMHSVVNMRAETLAAFNRAVLATLVGSMTPA